MFELLAQATPTITTTYELDATDAAGIAFFGGVWLLLWLALAIVYIVAMWKIFEKAGQPGWKSIVPFYNVWTLCEIAGKPGWWSLSWLVVLIPVIGWMFGWIVPFVVQIIIALELGKLFGKSTTFSVVALILFSFVGYLILGFGPDKYTKPTTSSTGNGHSSAPPA